MKKISAILLALVLVLSMTVAMAADDGSITIENTTNEQTYTIYKVFDATFVGDKVAYSYDGSNAALVAALTATDSPFEYDEVTDVVVSKDDASDDDILNWVKDNAANFGEAVATITGDGGAKTAEDLAYGYYYIVSSLGATVTIDSAIPDVSVVDKNEDGPGLPSKVMIVDGQEVESTSADVGTTIDFKVTGTLARYDDNVKVEKYTFVDTMTDGLTFNEDVVIKINGTQVNVTVTYANNGFTFELPTFVDGAFLYPVDAAYEVTYTATLNNNAVAGTPENNAFKLTWNNEEHSDSTTVVTYEIDVYKYTGSEDNGLAGAGFILKKGDLYYHYENGVVSWVAEENATEYTTATDAYTVTFYGLENGEYTLIEKTVPAGYNKIGDMTLTIADANLTGEAQVEVENKTGSELPETGGIGTTIFYVVGSLMMAAAIILLASKKIVASGK